MIGEIVFRQRNIKAQAILDVLPSIFGDVRGKTAVKGRNQAFISGYKKRKVEGDYSSSTFNSVSV